MIEVRGTRTAAAEDPVEKYVARTDLARSRTPFALGLALTAIGLYIRSMWGAEAPALPVPERGPAPDMPGGAPANDHGLAGIRRVRPSDEDAGAPAGEGGPAAAMPLAFHAFSATFSNFVGARVVSGVPVPQGGIAHPRPANDGVPRPEFLGRHPGAGGSGSSDSSGRGGGKGFDDIPIVTRPDQVPPGGDGPDGPGGSRPSAGTGGGTRPGGGTTPGRQGDGGDPGGRTPGTVSPAIPDDEEDEDGPGRQNRAPRISGPVFLMDITACGLLAIGLDDLLANAADPDGDALSVTDVTVSAGNLVADGAGWIYRAEGAGLGPVTISYKVSDGTLAVSQTASFSIVRPAPIIGTEGDDLLIGGLCADEIDGGAGDDNIDGRSGDDVIFGGAGDDHIVAGAGNDVVWGGAGNDIVFGGAGDDHIFGGAGNDRLHGDDGNDVIRGGEGDDFIAGGAGDDVLTGEAGSDELHDGAGADVVSGGEGDDLIVVSADRAADLFDGGDGVDTIDFSAATSPLVVDLTARTATSAETGRDVVQNVEIVIGGSGNDTIRGSELAEQLIGGAGDDVIHGLAGDDLLVGGDGDDRLHGGIGDDVLLGGEGDDDLFGGIGDDRLDGGAGDDNIFGGDGDDEISDGAGSDVVDAGAGDDRVIAALDGERDDYEGGEGEDTLDYSAATRAIVVDLRAGTAVGLEIGQDSISGFEKVIGGRGGDHFIAGAGGTTLVGGGGQNIFEFVPWAGAEGLVAAIHEILDFKHGDRIRLSKYDLFERAMDAFEDRFDTVYLGDDDDDRPWIRYRHDDDEGRRSVTRVEADFDRDNTFETTILIAGNHTLAFIENT